MRVAVASGASSSGLCVRPDVRRRLRVYNRAIRRLALEIPSSRRCFIATAQAPTVDTKKLEAARLFAIEAARLLAETRCNNVAVLDVSHVSPVTDFMVIATGTSPRQMKTAADDLEEMAEPRDFRPLSRAGDNGSNWTCVDFVDVVVHVFSAEARLYYDLDALWGDARPVPWQVSPQKSEIG